MQALTIFQRWRARLGRSRPARRHAWAVLLSVALALASVMQVAHTHEADVAAGYKYCSFCMTFDRGGAPPPSGIATVEHVTQVAPAIFVDETVPQCRVARAPCHPRAPPALQA